MSEICDDSSLVTLEVVGDVFPVMLPNDKRSYTQYIVGYRCCVCNTHLPRKDMYEHLVVKHKIPPSIVMFALDIQPISVSKTTRTGEIA